MINLEKKSGLPIFLTKDNKLGSKDIKLPKPAVRTFSQIKPVLLAKKTPVKKFYFMYRNVAPNPSLSKYSMRYDITVIPAHKIGKEEIKTAGHYHAYVRNTNVTYPEVYQVISGEATYLLQKKSNSKISDVIVAKAKQGEIIVVPPNYGHITINASKKTLVMANIVYSKFSSKYKEIMEKHGGAYYAVEKNKKLTFIKNPNYKNVPKIRYRKPTIAGLKSPIYSDCTKNPEKYIFLVKPQTCMTKFKI
ncbi:glucose-6-phosphate isomerase [Candidatus Woesearchaeota archaeon]|nr:glucose-6-phosphate isomerase [Candidatus Woesearchaeota archaeon]